MTYPSPETQPPTGHRTAGPAPAGRGKAPWIIGVTAGVLLLCCCGAVALVASDADDGSPKAAATQGGRFDDSNPSDPSSRTPGSEPSTEPEPEPEPGPEPVGFGAGIWEVGAELPPGTYVTTVPDGGFDLCYWARLSGFSGDFEELIANGNLNAGARGRVAVAESDAGMEFSGDCQWVEVSEAEPVEVGDEVVAGVWAVGDEVAPGTYITTAPDGDFALCYWARLSGFSGEFDDLIANGNLDPGARGRVTIQESDTGIEFSGDCTWTRS